MDFEKICTIFSMQEPYYGILLSAMDRFQTKKTDTIAVFRSGNVFRLGYNPDFLADKDLNETLILLKHECLHLAFNHLSKNFWDFQNFSGFKNELRKIAEDLEVNGYLDFSNTRNLIPCLASDFGWENKLGAMEYFKRLLQLVEQNQKEQEKEAQFPSMPCNGGRGGSGQKNESASSGQDDSESEQPNDSGKQSENYVPLPSKIRQSLDKAFDDHSTWPTDLGEEEFENLQQAVDDLLDFAAEEVEKSCGKLPGEMEGRIKMIREKKKPKPVADWKKHFRRYIGNEFSDQIKKSRKRESKRFPDAAGNRHKRKSHILVAIDTSGSVSMPEYNEFFGQIKTMKDVTFHVVECDAMIQHEYDFRGKVPQTLHGGGGTSFQPVVDMYNKNRRKYEGLVYFTDGECSIPRDTPKETLWVVSSRGDHNRKKYLVNGASVVFIPKRQNNA